MTETMASQQRGPVGNTRSIGLSILWAILTLGIYTFVWTYKTQEEIKRYSGNGVGGVIGLVIYFLISPVTFFIVPSEVRYLYEDLDGQTSPVRGTTGLWFLLPLIGSIVWFVKVQGALNRYWQSKGGPPRTSTPTQSETGGTPLRAKCCAIATCEPDRRLAAHPPARRIGSCEDESFPIEIPTSGGARDSETS